MYVYLSKIIALLVGWTWYLSFPGLGLSTQTGRVINKYLNIAQRDLLYIVALRTSHTCLTYVHCIYLI